MADIFSSVQIQLDFKQYGTIMADKMGQLMATDLKNRARRTVRKRTRALMNSIKTIKITMYNYITVAETPYAAMQEWGPPSTPFWRGRRYSWTPYMEPSGEAVQGAANMKKLLNDAEQAALMVARRKLGKD